MSDQQDKDRRHDSRRSGMEMRGENDRRHEEASWPYLEKREGQERREGDDRRHSHDRRHETPQD